MVKKLGVILMGLFVVVFSGVNLYMYFNQGETSYSTISGMVTGNAVLEKMNVSLIAFILQWIILIMIVMFSYTQFIKQKKMENISEKDIPKMNELGNLETELDRLYELLKVKERLSIDSISKVFGIEKEKALEWAQILEEHDLVKIEYPAFSDPEIEIKDKIKKNE